MSNSRFQSPELVADVHYKMCKKIAQLTKVIYQLNTQNEDHVLDSKLLTKCHDEELKSISQDFELKLQETQKSLDTLQEIFDKRLGETNRSHEVELQQLKSNAEQREETIVDQFQTQISAIKADHSKCVEMYCAKVADLESNSLFLSDSIISNLQNYELNNAQLKQAHDLAIIELRKSHADAMGEKIQTLQIDNQKSIQILTDNFNIEKERYISDFNVRLQDEIELERSKMEQVSVFEINRREKIFTQQINSLIEGNDLKLKELNIKLQNTKNQFDSFRDQKLRTIAELNIQLENLQHTLGKNMGGHETQVQNFHNDISRLKHSNEKLEARVAEREEEIGRLQKLIDMKNTTILDLDAKLRLQESETCRLRSDYEASNCRSISTERELRARLEQSENDVNSMRSEINGTVAALSTLRDELKESHSSHRKAIEESEEAINGLQLQRDDLLSRVDSLTSQLSREANENARAVATAQNAIQMLKSAHSTAVEELTESHHRAMIAHIEESRVRTKTELAEQALKLQSDYNTEKNVAALQFENSRESLSKDYESQIQSANERHKTECGQLQTALCSLQEKFEKLTADSMRDQDSLSIRFRELSEELDVSRATSIASYNKWKAAEAIVVQKATDFDALKSESMAVQTELERRFRAELSVLNESWKSKLSDMDNLHAESIKVLGETLTENFRETEVSIRNAWSSEVEVLNKKLQESAVDGQLKLLKSQNECNMLQIQFSTRIDELIHEKIIMSKQHDDNLAASDQSHQYSLSALTRHLEIEFEQQKKELIERHKHELNNQNVAFEVVKAALNHHFKQELATALFELNSRLIKEKEVEKCEIIELHAANLNSVKQEATTEIEEIRAECIRVASELTNVKLELASSHVSISNQREAFMGREAAFETERLLAQQEFSRRLDEAARIANEQLRQMREQREEDKLDFNEELADLHAQYKKRLKRTEHDFNDMRDRYERRESRPDDLDLINRLKKDVSDRNRLIDRLSEEVNTVKRELMNREEVYNHKFNYSPTVGVMQVLKPQTQEPGISKRKQLQPLGNTRMRGKSTSKGISSSNLMMSQVPHLGPENVPKIARSTSDLSRKETISDSNHALDVLIAQHSKSLSAL